MLKKLFTITALSLSMATQSALASVDFGKELDALLEKHQLPGAVALIKQGEKVLHYQAHGKVNLKESELMAKDAIFRLFSMTKPVTAVALLQLIDQGKLALDDDIRKYLPQMDPFEVDGKTQVVTVHQLLNHSAGFGYGGGLSNWIDFRYLIANPLSRSNTNDDLVDDISGIDLKFEPGSRWEYSIASDIQGALIESVSGMPLDRYFQQYLFTPLKMKDTGFYVPKKDQNRLVDMYEYSAKTFEEAFEFNSQKIEFIEQGENSEYLEKPDLLSGGGGLVSTTADFSNFVKMLLNKGKFEGKQLLSEEMAAQMLTSHTQGLDTHFMPRVYNNVGFGYGVGVKEGEGDLRTKGSFFWSGMGGTVFWADPERNLQVVVMMQVEDGWVAMEKWLIPKVYQLINNQ